jgi:hypothetical protein
MQRLILCLSFCLSTFLFIGQENLTYSKIKIDLAGHSLKEVAALGLESDHGIHAPHKYLINIFSNEELELLDSAGIPYEIQVRDIQAFYDKYGTMDDESVKIESRSNSCNFEDVSPTQYTTPANYESGTMGGYLTYQGVLDNLDKMSALYPDLVTERMAIDTFKTHEGREIYYLVISNTPNAIDTLKPQVLYDALHHAREPNSVSNLLFYMWYLLENYGTDEEVTYLVDNTTMFFLPMVNPDGYVYNESIRPNGGGLWRKNRYVNPQGRIVGVDLNRNYGYFWAFDNQGSSNNENRETYRGPSAFSEPETQAVRALCNANKFEIALNYHTFGNLLIHPWGYSDEPTDEDVLFKSLANIMTIENDYLVGTGTETVGYVVNGDSDDWMYGEEEEKHKIYSLTPEAGPSFWPSANSIDDINKANVRLNLNTAHLLLNYGVAKEIAAENILTQESGTLFFELEKSGLEEGALSFSVVSSTPGFELSNNQYDDLNLLSTEKQEFQINYSVDPLIVTDSVKIEVRVDNGNYISKFEIVKLYNESLSDPQDVIVDDITDIANYSIINGDWGISEDKFFSAPFSITDSPDGNYADNQYSEIIILNPLITTGIEQAFLKFYTTYETEVGFDFAQLQMSQNGEAYEPLCGELTVESDDGPIYEGFRDWTQEVICLNDYLDAQELTFKFIFSSDAYVNEDGFYFDDFTYELFGDGLSSTSDNEEAYIIISPNPSQDQVRIVMPPSDYKPTLSYNLIDVMGHNVLSGMIRKPNMNLDISGYGSGTYILQLYDDDRWVSSTKIIKL